MQDTFGALDTHNFEGKSVTFYRLDALAKIADMSRLPVTIKILLEAALRQCDGRLVRREDVERIAKWEPKVPEAEIPFQPARIVLQDFTGVPAVVDLAVMRDAMHDLGGDPVKINPQIPVDLVIDHSVQVDLFGTAEALNFNMDREFERNNERYRFLHWAQKAFKNFRVVPPATGIVHQVNLEYLASVVQLRDVDGVTMAFPDTLVGTDSHTTMINGLGVLGWGVGGIEAEAGMLGQPLYFLLPSVVGFKLTGKLAEGATATDLALTVTHMLRQKGVVGKFVEFYGPGIGNLSLPDRATVANMAPEYGATVGYFPVDEETLRYLLATGRDEKHVRLVEWYLREQGLFRDESARDAEYSDTLELDLGSVQPTLAGPKRPQDRVLLKDMQTAFHDVMRAPVASRGFALSEEDAQRSADVHYDDGSSQALKQGAVVIAAITSCTNTSNPSVMVGAGLLANKAVELGLTVPRYVKTSMAPGSKVVRSYLEDAGLMPYLEKLGFHIVGYGCTTCIGNSGDLIPEVAKTVKDSDLTVAAVLSGNRNFEGRIHAQIKANYLASPPLVIAYALAGTVDFDMENGVIGKDKNGQPVRLKDIWPSSQEIADTMARALKPDLFRRQYADVFTGNERWNAIASPTSELYSWDDDSTYIQKPPYFDDYRPETTSPDAIHGARVLLLLGDSVTTDHISPAGYIPPESPAGKYLSEHGVAPRDFNSYGSRRGNDRVMERGTFANIRIRNELAEGTEGGYSRYLPTGEIGPVFDVARRYQEDGVPLIVLAGKEYGTGSSRDWAAKGPMLQGIRVVIAESFERIHRSNLVGMGVLPLQFEDGESWKSLGLTGEETYDFEGLGNLTPGQHLSVRVADKDGAQRTFSVRSRLDTAVDVEYYRNTGILQTVLKNLSSDVLL